MFYRRRRVALLSLSGTALILASITMWAQSDAEPERQSEIRFVDVTKPSGLHFKQSYGDHRLDNIVEATGTGVCIFDFNNDGFQDIYFPNAKWTPNVNAGEDRLNLHFLKNHLFRNNGDGTFTDVTDRAGLGGSRSSVGCSAGDFDNDGYVDLVVLNYGRNELFHNEGDGTFKDVSKRAGLTNTGYSLSAVWFDYNGDGYLDLFIGNYITYDSGRNAGYDLSSGYPGPLDYKGQSNLLYRNNGDGSFTEVTRGMGLWKPNGHSMSVTAADFYNDGRLELLSTNDSMENYFFVKNSRGVYEDRALEMNIAYGENGENVAHMGPAVGDVNRDGRLDVYIANLRDCTLLLQRPDGSGFDNWTSAARLSLTRGEYSGWSAIFSDFDHDGWLDIFTTNGGAQREAPQENVLYRNRGDGKFDDVSSAAGAHFLTKRVGRGAAQVTMIATE